MKFWLLQGLGWSLFLLLQLLVRAEDGNAWTAASGLYALSLTALGLLASLGLRALFRRLGADLRGEWTWLGTVLAASLSAALLADGLHLGFLHGLAALDGGYQALADDQPFGGRTPLVFLALLAWSFLYLGLSRQEHYLRAQHERQSLSLALQEAQLQALLAQLNPHFMFNTLNNIRALILKDPEAARGMLGRFAEILRYQLDDAAQILVSVEDEMGVVRDYLSLVGLQLGKRLRYEEEVAPEALGWRIPRLSVQLLVENAVKHGLSRRPGPGLLALRIAVDEQGLSIALRNSGELAEAPPGTRSGIGLNNLRQRLALAFGQSAEFSLRQDGDGVLARLHIRNT
ncbi:MAG: histidine kinase [Gammaproteobacteria bacterium]|nr:histidine kinase [Gammaproteobacteria bacterium]